MLTRNILDNYVMYRYLLSFSPILLILCNEYLTKKAFEGLGDFKIVGQVIRNVKYADDIVLLFKEETVLRGVIDGLILDGR